jgi:6-pyruvoyltetrahydropterin/6-carboxytetrahydropterin synthase
VIYITRKFHFSASHRLYKEELSDEENYKLYGKCSNPNGHGHNYILEITIEGEINKNTGYVMDLSQVKDIVEKNIIQKTDHKNLNTDVDFMQGIIPSAENIAAAIWKELYDKFNFGNCRLYSVRIKETENNSAEYRG